MADREYFKAFFSGKNHRVSWVARCVKQATTPGRCTFARELIDANGIFRGVVVAAVNLGHFERRFDYMRFDEVRPISLYLADGTLVASLPHREYEIGKRAGELASVQLPIADGEALRSVSHAHPAGERQIFTLGRVPDFPLLVGVTNEENASLASWRETAIPIALGLGVVCILIVFVATLLVRELLREEALANALLEADDRYQRTIDSVTDAIVAIDQTQTILMFNPAAENMFGLPANEAIGSSPND